MTPLRNPGHVEDNAHASHAGTDAAGHASTDAQVSGAGGVNIQHLIAKLDAVSNALATVDANLEHTDKGLAEIEEIARHCKQGMEPTALLLVADIAKGLR